MSDKRKPNGIRHKLIDIIAIAICGVICGGDDWVMIEYFGNAKREWFETFLELPHGIPSHDTFGKVFALIDPQEFQESFLGWVHEIAEITRGQLIAIDGKTARRSHDQSKGREALHLVSAWASQNGLVLGQVKVDDKSNEIRAIPELLKMLDIHGCLISIDAIGTQKEIVSTIIEQGGDYLLTVKQNQGSLYDQIASAFNVDYENEFKDTPYDYSKKVNKGHGRIETRECWITSDPEYINYIDPEGHWQKLSSLIILKATRVINGETSVQIRYFISSAVFGATQIMKFIRQHWEVENKLHWSLDVSFNEDSSRVRTGHAPENLALLRKMALNLLRLNKSKKCGAKTKRMLCAVDTNFLLEILNS
ncbi:MAG: ISAs1 family transposase [Anaerolineae bacterium]|nr:ISAs1 family transposase [Anaerolineae bacterium]